MVEDTVLKTAGCESFAGSIPVLSVADTYQHSVVVPNRVSIPSIGAAVAQFLDMEEVTGSNPVSTIARKGNNPVRTAVRLRPLPLDMVLITKASTNTFFVDQIRF